MYGLDAMEHVEKTVVELAAPLRPMEDHDGVDTHNATCGGPLKEAEACGETTQEWAPGGSCGCVERSPCTSSLPHGNCGLWGTHAGAVCF